MRSVGDMISIVGEAMRAPRKNLRRSRTPASACRRATGELGVS